MPCKDNLGAEQAVASRRLLQSSPDSAAVVQVQMTGADENATAAIAQELGSVVANNALEVCRLPFFQSGFVCTAHTCRQKCVLIYNLRMVACMSLILSALAWHAHLVGTDWYK